MITVSLRDHGRFSYVIRDTGEAPAIHPRVAPKVIDFPLAFSREHRLLPGKGSNSSRWQGVIE
jgi:hypothetical protein